MYVEVLNDYQRNDYQRKNFYLWLDFLGIFRCILESFPATTHRGHAINGVNHTLADYPFVFGRFFLGK